MSGPRVARLFHALLALLFLDAWLSLGSQIHVLVGSRGLLPAAELFATAPDEQVASFWQFPTLLRWWHGDDALTAGVVLGVALALLALLGLWPRAAFALSSVLYLSYALVTRDFCGFQWDNLLIECGALAALLDPRASSPVLHALFRVLCAKLYFESGVAKWGSAIGDWQDGSAMTFYYETSPIPTWLAWYAHNLPARFHHLESWATLGFELGAPLLVFGPRVARRFGAVVLGAFQLLNLATSNYGFFAYNALALHVFLLDDALLIRVAARLRRRAPKMAQRWRRFRARLRLLRRAVHAPARFAARAANRAFATLPKARERLRATGFAMLLSFAVAYVGLSAVGGVTRLLRPAPALGVLSELYAAVEPFRVVNVYHLFAQVTETRVEPELQTFDGASWAPHDLRYKPGRVDRAPPFVAPHQPRVDFLLWFHGLAWQRTPPWVGHLAHRACDDPQAVDELFVEPLPRHAVGVRIVYYRYRFTTRAERRASGAWWTRTELGATRNMRCH